MYLQVPSHICIFFYLWWLNSVAESKVEHFWLMQTFCGFLDKKSVAVIYR